MEFKLKILSPVHIGCGESYNAMGYLLDKRFKPERLAVFDERAIFDVLDDKHKAQFARWIENERRPNLFNFMRNVIRDENFRLSNQIQKKANYVIPNLAGNEPLKDINAFIKQMNSAYIPGTEIKGAIRTAILYCMMQDEIGVQDWLRRELESFQNRLSRSLALVANKKNLDQQNPDNPRQKLKKLKEFIEKEMGSISDQLEERVLACKPDAKYDVMKFMQVGDSNLLDSASSLMVSFAEPFNMSKKFRTYHEYLSPNTLVPLTSFKLEDDRSRTKKLNQMEFTERHKNLMSGLDSILLCCYRFANDLLEEEIAYFSIHNKLNIVAQLRKIKELNTKQSPVLRIGKDEGHTSLTVGLAVKKLMPELYENVLIHATKGISYDSQHGGPLPKSRKIVHWGGQEMTAGWVKLIPPSDSTPPDHTSRENAGTNQTKPDTTVDFSGLINKFKRGNW